MLKKNLIFYACLLKTSIKASISKRGAFLIEASLIIFNNLIFFSIWWIFFNRFQSIAGWEIRDMAALMALGTGSWGLSQIFFGGVKSLSQLIISGGLDPFMTQPKNLLLHIMGSISYSKGWGHFFTALTLMLLMGLTFVHVLLMAVGLICGCFVFTSTGIIAHSLAFWMGSIENVTKKYCDSVFLFSIYPTNIYSGGLQIVMFTLIPAGVIGYLPVQLLREFSWPLLFALIVSTCLFLALAVTVFYAGLRRYESGNQFGMRF